MGGSRHRGFKSYEYAARLADDLHAEIAGWPSFEMWTIGVQLVRAADSIGANIAEGFGRGSGPDRRRMFLIARGSVIETEHWIERACARGSLDDAYLTRLHEVARLLNGLIRSER